MKMTGLVSVRDSRACYEGIRGVVHEGRKYFLESSISVDGKLVTHRTRITAAQARKYNQGDLGLMERLLFSDIAHQYPVKVNLGKDLKERVLLMSVQFKKKLHQVLS